MKKIISAICLTMLAASMAFSQSLPQGKEQLVGIATGAIRAECGVTGPMQSNIRIVSACFVDNFVHEVTFYQTPQCPANQPCPLVIRVVGSVLLDCGNNVIGVRCGPPTFPL